MTQSQSPPVAHFHVENGASDATRPAIDRLLRAKQIHAPNGILPISRSTFFTYIRTGLIPVGQRLGSRIVVWRQSDILAFVEQQEAQI